MPLTGRPGGRGIEMEVSAKLKRAPLSAYKARLIAEQIRGKNVEEAISLLTFSTKKGSHLVT